jgi:hypothetical protein
MAAFTPSPPIAMIAENIESQLIDDLYFLADVIKNELFRRAIANNDLDATLEDAFDKGFDSSRTPLAPYVQGSLLICPGYKRNRGKSAHDCAFVSVDGLWSWEHPLKLIDKMNKIDQTLYTISILAVDEGLMIDQVFSKAGLGGHQVKKVNSFTLSSGTLISTSSRSASAPATHR